MAKTTTYETKKTQPSNLSKYLIEFLWTMFLVLTIALSTKSWTDFAPFAIASVLILLIYAGAHISWANYNPAVSFWLFLSWKLSQKDMINYILSQVVWAFIWAVVGYIILWSSNQLVVSPASWVDMWSWVLAEFLFTFLLVFTVLQVATSKKIQNNQYFGLAIWLVVLVWAISVWKISWWAFNPAVAFWPQLFDVFVGWSSINNILWYLLAGFGWAALASKAYDYTEKNLD